MKQRYVIYSILLFVTLFHAILLFPQVAALSPSLNDDVFHYSMCVSMAGEFTSGGNPIDHWVPYWSMGFPVFHYYQYLPHLVVVLTYLILFKTVSLFLIYNIYLYLLLVLYPLIIYFSMRKLELSRPASAGAAVFSLMLTNIGGYGFEIGSFVWRGFGLFSQLWAMVFFPLAICSMYWTLKENKGYFRSAAMLFVITMSQVMFGLIAIITSVIFLFRDIDIWKILNRGKTFLLVLLFFAIAAAHFLLPIMMDGAYHAHSVYDFPEKWDSFGPKYVITQFFNGNVMDQGRIPVATIFAVAGLFIVLGRRAFKYRWLGIAFILWFLLYFGRPVWGPLIDIMPLSSDLHLHRFVTMVHFFGAILAGIALAALYPKLKKYSNAYVALAVIAVILCPVFWDKYLYLKQNNIWIYENKAAYVQDKNDLDSVINKIKDLPPGRVYPGRRANWGGQEFKIGQTSVMYFLGPEEIPTLSFLPFSWAIAGDFSDNFNEFEQSHYNLFNIKYVLADKGRALPKFLKEIKSAGRFYLYLADTTGYFDLVEAPIAVYADKNSIWNIMVLWLRSPMVAKKQHLAIFFDRKEHKGFSDYMLFKDKLEYWDLRSEVNSPKVVQPKTGTLNVFETPDPMSVESYKPVSAGKVLMEKAGKNEFSGRVFANKDCYLLFKMTYSPGWNAYIDGRESEKTLLSPGFVGVKLTKGTHDVKFIYRAQKWKMPMLFAGMLVLAGLFVWERKRK